MQCTELSFTLRNSCTFITFVIHGMYTKSFELFLLIGRGKRSEIKTESNRVVDSNTDKQIQPIAVSRSGRQLKVATQRVTTQFHMESVGTRKRRPRGESRFAIHIQ